MELSEIHFHDTRILRVIEDTTTDTLTMDVQYPIDWDQNRFERRSLIFSEAHSYQVFEGPFSGPPTIIDAQILGNSDRRIHLRLQTNAGYRELSFASVRLSIDNPDT